VSDAQEMQTTAPDSSKEIELVRGTGLTAPLPCRHGCTCRLHDQVVLGTVFEGRKPEDIDHGEMRALSEAAVSAQRLLDGFHDQLKGLRHQVTTSRGAAVAALERLATLQRSQRLATVVRELRATEEQLGDLEPDQVRSPNRLERAVGYCVVLGIASFDVAFFFQTMRGILRVPVGAPIWFKLVVAIPGAVLAIGLILSGRLLGGPFWRVSRRLRVQHPAGARRMMKVWRGVVAAAAILAFPVALFGVLGLWAWIRGGMADDPEWFPPPWTLVALLLCMSLSALVIEIHVSNPFARQLHEARRSLADVQVEYEELRGLAGTAIGTFEDAWRDLRSARDELLGLIQTELMRPWQDLIHPARFISRAAGPLPPAPNPLGIVPEEHAPVDRQGPPTDSEVARASLNEIVAGLEDSMRPYRGVPQPVPALGPLAEVVRQLREQPLHELSSRRDRLVEDLDGQLGGTITLPRDAGTKEARDVDAVGLS
jgi:hypothetical protein